MSQSFTLNDTQSIIQLAIALNFAFGAYDAISNPLVSTMRNLAISGVDKAKDAETKLAPVTRINSNPYPPQYQTIMNNRFNDHSIAKLGVSNIALYDSSPTVLGYKFPYYAGAISAICGLVGFVILAITPFFKNLELSIWAYIIMIGVIYLPVLFFILLNLLHSKGVVSDIIKLKKEVAVIDQVLSRHVKHYAPALRDLRQQGYII